MNKNNDTDKGQNSTNINWYPGHMVKAQNEIKDSLKLIDVVVEVLDARIPKSSRNPLIDSLAPNKARIIVLNKSDLADKENLESWKNYFNKKGYICIDTNANISSNILKLVNAISKKGEEIYAEKNKNKTIQIKPIYRVLIIGIPNVGKSTIINKIANKQIANTGNKPGVTKKKQWIRVGNNIDLLDTPGLLWPKLNDDEAGIKLALTGNIKQEIIDLEVLSVEGILLLKKNKKYLKLLKEKYKLTDDEILLESYEILEIIGKKRGCLVSGGKINIEKAANIFIEELKSGKIGNISFDEVE